MTETTARRNRPYAPRMTPEQRREQLLDATLEIINTDGVAAVSMDGVARHIGVTRPVVYGVFSDTNDLLRASLDREEQRALAQLSPALSAAGGTSLSDTLIGLADTFLRAIAEAAGRWRAIYMIADSGTPAFHRRVNRGRRQLTRQLQNTLHNSGRFDPSTDLELLAHYLFAALWESGRLQLAQPDDFDHDRQLRALTHLITTLIPPTNPPPDKPIQ